LMTVNSRAYKVGEESFEQQGHRMIAEVLADQP